MDQNIITIGYDRKYDDPHAVNHHLLSYLELRLRDIRIAGSKCIFTRDIHSTLIACAAAGFEWAVVMTPGCFYQDHLLGQLTVEHAKQMESPLCAHIIDKDGYFYFHHQWFALDLDVYRDIGFPQLEESRRDIIIKTPEVDRSTDNIHDHYTPLWLAPKEQSQLREITLPYRHFGVELISALMSNGHRVVNVPKSIRNKKGYCYPESNGKKIREIIDSPGSEYSKDQDRNLWELSNLLNKKVADLSSAYYALNTESIQAVSSSVKQHQTLKFDRYAGVCGGIKNALIVGEDQFVEGTSILLFDISQAAIDWQKYLLANWDGNIHALPELDRAFVVSTGYRSIVNPVRTIEKMNWNTNDHLHLLKKWRKYKNCEFKFLKLDVLQPSSWNFLADDFESNAKLGSYLWLSNCFMMDYNYFYHGKFHMQEMELYFETIFEKKIKSKPVVVEKGNQLKYYGPYTI